MLLFTDGSAMKNPPPTRAGAFKKNGSTSLPIKLAKALTSSGTSYDEQLERIDISTEYPKENISD